MKYQNKQNWFMVKKSDSFPLGMLNQEFAGKGYGETF